MASSGWGSSKELGPFAALLAALVIFMGLVPLVGEEGIGRVVVRVGFTVVLIAGLGVARENRGFFAIAIALLCANMFVQWLLDLLVQDPDVYAASRSAVGASYLGYLVVVLLRSLIRQREASMDTVLGGINVYLLLAVTFLNLHLLLETIAPGSYVQGGLALSDPLREGASLQTTLFYFSFTTLTTLGYGDIAPARPVAQFLCSAEAVIGQLYVAIFIGGLVALRIAVIQKEFEASEGDRPSEG